jgi:stearoyl-CoA desaturase (delta-9 desaturase)
MTNYAKSIKRAARMEIQALRATGADSAASTLKKVRKWLHLDDAVVPAHHREAITQVVASSPTLATTLTMKQELARLWERSTLSTEQLVAQLRDWCERAEKSNVEPLVQFARRLRCYA